MRHILFLFAASLLILACSNDDENPLPEEQNTELKIKKFTSIEVDSNGNPTGDRTDYSFDQNGLLTEKIKVDYYFDNTEITYYTYNPLGQLTESRFTYLGVPHYRIAGYLYDTENKLDKIFTSYDDDTPEIWYELTHEPNKIRITHRSPGAYDAIHYNNNTITYLERWGDLGAYSKEDLTYDTENNIIERKRIGTNGIEDFFTNRTYTYDDKKNPLFHYFKKEPLNLLGENFFNIDYCNLFFSPHNFTSEVSTSNTPLFNYSFTRTFQYNEEGFPTSAIVKKDGVLSEELTYEYY